METTTLGVGAMSAATVHELPATPPVDRPAKRYAFLHRRLPWVIGALIVLIAGVSGYYWTLGKAKRI